MARSKSSTTNQANGIDRDPSAAAALATDLSYSEAQTALELVLAQLQSSDLAVEDMTALYERGRAYAQRCEQVLQQVEQTIELWDPQTPEAPPQSYSAAQSDANPAVTTTPGTTTAASTPPGSSSGRDEHHGHLLSRDPLNSAQFTSDQYPSDRFNRTVFNRPVFS